MRRVGAHTALEQSQDRGISKRPWPPGDQADSSEMGDGVLRTERRKKGWKDQDREGQAVT